MFYRLNNTKGFYLIGLLIALLIIMILTGKYMTGDKGSGIEPAVTNIDKSKIVRMDNKAYDSTPANWRP